MDNRIEIGIEFSFKGENYHPRATLDLDALMEKHGALPELHHYLATENRIDTYSYLYEALESYEIVFANATGLAAECLDGDDFDAAAFERRWGEARELRFLQELAVRHLGVAALDEQPRLLAALREAYEVGKSRG